MCTLEKRGSVFLLTLTGSDQHRFSPTLIDSLLSALRQAKSEAIPGSVLVTTSHGKFFSNGFDLSWAQAAGKANAKDRLQHMVDQFKTVVAELISLPMPTIAAVQGHAAAAGMVLALSHDYVLMRSDRGVLYMSELDIGMSLPDYFAGVFGAKLGSVPVRRDVLLRGAKLKGEEAMRLGIVDSAHADEAELDEAAMRFGEGLAKRKWYGEIYTEIRKSLYPGLCDILGLDPAKAISRL